jgi:nitrite reductase (NO-forming)
VIPHLRPPLRTGLLVAVLVLSVALTAACQVMTAPAGSGSGQQVTVRALDTMRFNPESANVQAGQPVRLTLTNDGTLIHDLILNQGVSAPFKLEANGKSSVSGTLTLLQPGTYTYVCAQPGHEAAGMKGTIVAR